MQRRWIRLVWIGLMLSLACRVERPPIEVKGHQIVVRNETDVEWRDLEVWVNDHYRVTAARLLAGQQLNAPLSTFVAGYGQRFNPAHRSVFGVLVTAKEETGKPLRLVWGKVNR